MKKNTDPKTAQLFEAARAAYIENYSHGVVKSPIAKNVTVNEITRYMEWQKEDDQLLKMIEDLNGREIEHGQLRTMEAQNRNEYRRRRRAISNNIAKCGFRVFLQDSEKVIQLIDGYQCGIMSLPRIYNGLCKLVGEKPVEIVTIPIMQNNQPTPAPIEDAAPAPVAVGFMSGETIKGRVHYVNSQDKAVSRVMELERVNFTSPLPMWVMSDDDYYFIVFQLSDNIFFRSNGCGFNDRYMSGFRGDFSVYDKETIINTLETAAAIPAKQFTPEYWPNMAVVNAYKSAGMLEEAEKLMAIRDVITKQREEKRKARQEEAERKEQEQKQAEEKRLNEAAADMLNKKKITGRDIVTLCDREGIKINPRTRHNLLEVVNYYENGSISYWKHGNKRTTLDGCFIVINDLLKALQAKQDTEATEEAAPVEESAPIEESAPAPIEQPAPAEQPETDPQAAAMSVDDIDPEPVLYTASQVEKMIAAAVEAALSEQQPAPMPASPHPSLFSRLLRIAAVVVPLFILAMFTASAMPKQAPTAAANTATAAAADDAIYFIAELPAVTVTDSTPTPANQKTAATPSSQKTDTNGTPSGQKTDTATASPSHTITLCAGTAWQYTMTQYA